MRHFTFFHTSSFTSFLVLTLLRLDIGTALRSQCYYPDGSIPTDYLWEPCTGAKYSSCCVPSEGDVCQKDGLCYYPDEELVYRGTCTDQTWKDPSCNVGSCVSGFETTWQWVGECVSPGNTSTSTVCGSMSATVHATPTCNGDAVLNTVYVTTTSTSSAHIYSAPPSIDTSRFSVETNTYTTTITANAQQTTLTSTFESTKTHTLTEAQTESGSSAVAAATVTETASDASATPVDTTVKKTAMLVGIGIGVIFVVIMALAMCFFLYRNKRKNRPFNTSEAIKLDNTNYPPPNGPVGADQVYPYEAPVNEVTSPPKKYNYTSPKVDAYEMDDGAAVLREKRDNGAMEMHADESGLRSPAPAYHEAMMPVELDGTSSFRGR